LKRLSVVAVALLASSAWAIPDWAQAVTERVPGVYLGLFVWQWLLLAAILIFGVLLDIAGGYIAKKLVRLRESTTGAKSQIGERSVRRGTGLLALTLPWYVFRDILELPLDGLNRLNLTVEALTIVAVVLLAYGIWDIICDSLIHRAASVAHAERLLIPVTRKLVRFLILIAGVVAALGVFGVNITGLLAGVGIGGLVVALAAKDSVENVFGSLTILFDMPFALGDWVKIDKVEGIVEQINLRSTKIRTFDDSLITLPNSNLIKAAVENYGARRYRRQRFQVRVSYVNDAATLEHFMEIVRAYLEKVPNVVPARNIVEIYDMTEVSVGILVQCFFEADSFQEEAQLRGQLILAIFNAQKESGVHFVGVS
jgi:MscS family membrane protein